MILFSYFMHVASKWMQCVEVMLLLEILAVFTACKNNKLKKKCRFSHLFESNFKPCRHGTLNAPGLCWMPHGTWSINTLRQFHTMNMVLEYIKKKQLIHGVVYHRVSCFIGFTELPLCLHKSIPLTWLRTRIFPHEEHKTFCSHDVSPSVKWRA